MVCRAKWRPHLNLQMRVVPGRTLYQTVGSAGGVFAARA